MTAKIHGNRTMATTSVQLTPEQVEALQALADRTHRSFAAVIREAVDLLIERDRKVQLLLAEQEAVTA